MRIHAPTTVNNVRGVYTARVVKIKNTTLIRTNVIKYHYKGVQQCALRDRTLILRLFCIAGQFLQSVRTIIIKIYFVCFCIRLRDTKSDNRKGTRNYQRWVFVVLVFRCSFFQRTPWRKDKRRDDRLDVVRLFYVPRQWITVQIDCGLNCKTVKIDLISSFAQLFSTRQDYCYRILYAHRCVAAFLWSCFNGTNKNVEGVDSKFCACGHIGVR